MPVLQHLGGRRHRHRHHHRYTAFISMRSAAAFASVVAVVTEQNKLSTIIGRTAKPQNETVS